MSTLFEIYSWAIGAAVLFAAALTLTGCHLAGRDRSMQTMCIGQGAMLGVLFGLGVVMTFFEDNEPAHVTVPFVAAIVVAIGVYILSAKIASGRVAAKNTYFTAIFGTLLAGGALVSALFPALENHMSQAFFGDLATLSSEEAYATLGLAAALLVAHGFLWRRFASDSFNLSILGESTLSAGKNWTPMVFNVLSLVAICFAVQLVGFLFTIACLFVPTTIMNFARGRTYRRHIVLCLAIASVSAVVGFSLSLYQTTLPTVPTIVASMILLSGLLLAGERRLQKPLAVS